MGKSSYISFNESSDAPANSDSEFIEASELLAREKNKPHKTSKPNPYHEDADSTTVFVQSDLKRKTAGNRKPGKNGNKKSRVIFGAVAALVGVLIGVLFFGIWYKEYLLNKITYEPNDISVVDENGDTVEFNKLTDVTKNPLISDKAVKNFLLVGIDSRSKNYSKSGKGDRSDCMVIMSINTKDKTIKLLSIARDSYAYIPGYSKPNKINAAMSFGGAPLLQATVMNNLRINIDGYAYVNFSHMAEIVDAVGGVYVDVSEAEKKVANQYIREMDKTAAEIENTGKNTWLSGIQAVGYARNRYTGNGDYERMERQIEVLRSVFTQYSKLSASKKVAAMDDVLSAIITNIPKKEIEKYVFDFLPTLKEAKMEYMQLPISGCYNYGTYSGEWSMRVNWNAMIPYVQKYFYGKTVDFDEVRIPPRAPELSECKTEIPLEKLVH